MTDTLKSNLSKEMPLTFSHAATGETIVVNGLDQPQRWDGITSGLENAGIPAADTCAAALSGTSTITGLYGYAVRFLDDESQPGNISDLSTFTAASDALVSYSSIPVSTDGRVTQRQIWRTTAGQTTTLYLDATIANNTDTTATSSFLDDALAARTALPVLTARGKLNARRFGVPPNHKSSVVSHQERTFWAVDAVIDEGHIEMTSGSVTCVVVGQDVTTKLATRKLSIRGHGTVYTVSTASTTPNSVYLSTAFTGPTNLFSKYTIRPAASERNLIYWSELSESESVPATNAIRLRQEEGDQTELTAQMSLGSFLWEMTSKRMYRWSFQTHPVDDGQIWPTAHRGCLNQRCFVQVEGMAYIMDKRGIYQFNGGTARPISQIIQNLFRSKGGIAWDRKKWFHAEHFPAEETVKFYVCLDGNKYPHHSICYHYRKPAWWIEQYPWAVSSSAIADVGSDERLCIGSSAERIMLTSEGTLDGPKLGLTSRGDITSATHTSVTVSSPIFSASDIVLCPIQIVKGRGKGQTRIIFKANATTGRLDIDRLWTVKPDANSKYQIGGIDWKYRTRWFRYQDSEEQISRNIRVGFTPTDDAANMDIRYLESHKSQPVNMDGNSQEFGIAGTLGSPDLEVDLQTCTSGWNKLSIDNSSEFRGPSPRFMAAEIRGVQNKDLIVIHELGIDGVHK